MAQENTHTVIHFFYRTHICISSVRLNLFFAFTLKNKEFTVNNSPSPKKLINNLFFILYLLCCVGFVLFVWFFFNPFPTGVLAGFVSAAV